MMFNINIITRSINIFSKGSDQQTNRRTDGQSSAELNISLQKTKLIKKSTKDGSLAVSINAFWSRSAWPGLVRPVFSIENLFHVNAKLLLMRRDNNSNLPT